MNTKQKGAMAESTNGLGVNVIRFIQNDICREWKIQGLKNFTTSPLFYEFYMLLYERDNTVGKTALIERRTIMVRRMKIMFEEHNMEDYYNYTAIVKRLNDLKNDPEKSGVVPKIYKVGTPHLAGQDKATRMYSDLMIYFNDNYEKTIKSCLRPYYLK